jgi:hypothetical protein
MNPKTFLSKTTSVIASIVLAIGGSLIATQPASATSTAMLDSLDQSGVITLTWSECGVLSGTYSATGLTVYKNSSVITPSSVTTPSAGSGILLIYIGGTAVTGDVFKVVFDNTNSGIICGSSGSAKPSNIASGDNVTVTTHANNNQQNQQQNQAPHYTMTTAPSYVLSNGVATANDGTWSGTGGTINRWWVLCDAAKTAAATMPPNDCHPIFTAATGGTMEKGTTLTTQTTFYRPGPNQNDPRVAMTFASSYLLLYIAIGDANYMTATQAGPAPQQNNNVTSTVERSIPTPVFQAPILNSLAPKMSAGFSSNGGRLVLKDVKPTDITSVTLNGKTVAVVPSKSGAALRIPAGAGAGDLKFTMADGTVIDVANAVKITQSQVDPKLVDLNNLPTFKAGSVAVPATIKAALTKNKEVILDSANAKCVGYASSNTAAAKATALSRASNVCGVITDMNENIEPIIKVLVNKVVAKKSPVKYQTW